VCGHTQILLSVRRGGRARSFFVLIVVNVGTAVGGFNHVRAKFFA